MEHQIIVKYPEELAFSLNMEDSEFEKNQKVIADKVERTWQNIIKNA